MMGSIDKGRSQARGQLRKHLLRGTSVVALVTALGTSQGSAQSLSALRASVTGANAQVAKLLKPQAPATPTQNTAGMSAEEARALQYQSQVAQAISLAQQAQSAARTAVLGAEPAVPDGLVFGGLNPVADPVPAAQDPTGLNTWQGASAPTETTTGNKVQVTIQQTQQNAILSWQTFNVGPNTTLDFNQTQGGVAQPGWVVLNRVVGQLDPLTGLRNPNLTPAPSQIFGAINAQGTVLIINQNGILFGGSSQINVNSLIATSLEVGRAIDADSGAILNIADRNQDFLNYGLLGYADQASPLELPSAFTFSSQAISSTQYDALEGEVEVNAGANIQAGTGGFVLLTGPKVVNSGSITAPEGQVSLQSGRLVTLQTSNGSSTSIDPNVRGFVVSALDQSASAGNYVLNTATGIIDAPQGYVSLQATDSGAVINDGILEATTSVSRNGYITLEGGDIQLGLGSTIAIGPDASAETIPQDPTSLEDFKPSGIDIGTDSSRIEIQQNAMIYAPSGNITIGADPGPDTDADTNTEGTSRIFIDTGAVIDAAGLPDVVIPASRNAIEISPVTANSLADSPDYRDGFLNGATVYVDPRISGVSADGVAWVGSPLIPAQSYAEQVGVTVQELMTPGGNVTLGVQSSTLGPTSIVPDVTVKSGAVIDVSGGWVTYQAGWVQTTELVDASGNIVNIADADPNDTFIGIYDGYVENQARWGISQTYANPLLFGSHYEGQYSEGRDAGSLTIKGSTVVLDGTVYANAFPGPLQIADAQIGTASSSIYGDQRTLQAAPSQLPSGGFLFVQAFGTDTTQGVITGGGDIDVVDQADYQPVSSSLIYGQSVSIDANGNLVVPTRDPASFLPQNRIDTIMLSADAISNMGLSDVSLGTSGQIDLAQGADITLAPGGLFNAEAGRTITVDGNVSVPSGTIDLQTIDLGIGSVYVPETAQLGSFDVVVNGSLSARGSWVNDYQATPASLVGSAYLNGGNIDISVAPRVTLYEATASVADTLAGNAPTVNVDISGSILINDGALLDVSGGGYVAPNGALTLTAKGGNVSLIDATTYFQLTDDSNKPAGGIEGFRVTTIDNVNGTAVIPVNPNAINSRVSIADGSILAAGFGGGGTFTLTTPAFSFGDGTASTGTELPMGFISQTGFANYNITSYATDLLTNTFNNGLGGYNAVLAAQTLTVGPGQTLLLTQTTFSPILTAAQGAQLRALQTGGDLYSVLTPSIAPDAWDQHAVNLTLGGLIELDVASGGEVLGAAGGTLTVSKLENSGTIIIPGGTIHQLEVLPQIYGQGDTLGVQNLDQVFTTNPDGSIDEGAQNAAGIANLTNAQLAAQYQVYLLGDLGANVGIYLAPGSVTDLSGVSIRDPRASEPGYTNFVDGQVVAGGTLESTPSVLGTSQLFAQTIGVSVYTSEDSVGLSLAEQIDAAPGATIGLAGASDVFDRLGPSGAYVPTPVWSNAGTLDLGNGGTLTGANINAHGGAPAALGGTLVMLDPVLYQNDPQAPTENAISSAAISASGFETFVAVGSVSSVGNVQLDLGRGFFLTSPSYPGFGAIGDNFAPTISSGGTLEIDAPYINLDSILQTLSTPDAGTVANNSVILSADQIDIEGAVLFDQSVANVSLDATGDIRLIGVEPYQQTLNINTENVPNSLAGQLAVNGNLTITAGQIYPTTGSTFYVTSSAANGTIAIAKAAGATPSTPYSAGGNLTIQAANIVQGGVVRVPIGSLTIGGNSALTIGSSVFAPATESVQALSGSVTSVSAKGLSIPYGTTTDQTEWYFSPTNSSELTAPPQAILTFGGSAVTLNSGATVDISGGGDLYAYEFIPGTGGSRDVLDRDNPDEFSGTNGYQYPDGRQVYAIVPGLSSATAAAFDPIYSANYSDLYSATNAGQSVYLSAAPGLAAGWYTLLPAQYAMLPGGMRVVQLTGAAPVAMGTETTLADGSLEVAGYYGTAGTNSYSSTVDTFEVQSQSAFLQYSQIALTSADAHFAALAASNGVVSPQLPIDAARLVLAPSQTLAIDTTLLTTPGPGGRGAEVDISGSSFDIVSTLPDSSPDGTIVLTADSLTNLDAASLLIGGVRTDNADGTTSLDITANAITIANDSAHPLSGPEMIFAVDGSGAGITVADGASITATGTTESDQTGNYIIDGSTPGMTGQGALLRVSSGTQRLVTRENIAAGASLGVLNIGQANIQGTSVLLDSSGGMTVNPDATIGATDLALGAQQAIFAPTTTGHSGLVITPALQTLFGEAKELTIDTPFNIYFSSGTYTFADLQLITPGIRLLDGSAVTLNTGNLMLSNSGVNGGTCGAVGAPLCGTGSLTINAGQIDFGSGTLHTYGFGGSTTLSAPGGIFFTGNGAFDAGPGDLNLQTPFIGDEALTLGAGVAADLPSLAIASSGAITITNPTSAPVPVVAGTPGASLSIGGQSVAITDTELRATAGTLTVTSATGITVGGSATLETPGYAETFGDSADPVSVSAPGGKLELTALAGDIDLGSGTLLSVGGGQGTAGTLELSAGNGNVVLGGSLNADAPGGGGSFLLDTGGSFDGNIQIQSGSGNLVLSAGETLDAANVALTADGGLVDIAGTIDVAGTNGGEVDLFGLTGVTLESTSLIDAHANGYGVTDTRQASGGTVDIGTDGTGAITVDSGAVIDVAALQTEARLVPTTNDGVVDYTYVAGDTGGTVNFRAPIVESAGGETVNVSYAGDIEGASAIVLEGFERFELGTIAGDPNFVGVTINSLGQAVLDVGAIAGAGQANFLADNAPGTLVNFVQNFDISASYGNLGGLASQADFSARPGMELDYAGDIVLASNWNLGAGTVNVAGAVAAGLMAPEPTIPGDYYVLPGDEAQVFSQFTTMTYRVGGSVTGAPGILTIRAGGNLDLDGSITDGFFQFADQTDPNYLDIALGGGNRVYTPYIAPGCFDGSCSGIEDWQAGALPADYVSVSLPSAGGLGGLLENFAPYSAAANSPAALGSLPGDTGDPLGSAQLFPLVTTSGGTQAVDSWAYRLVGGADLSSGIGGTPSVNPMLTAPGAAGDVVVAGLSTYTYSAIKGSAAFTDSLMIQTGSQLVSPDQWYASFVALNPQLDSDAFTFINFATAPAAVRDLLANDAPSFFAAYPDQFQMVKTSKTVTGVTTTLAIAATFIEDVISGNFISIVGNYNPPKSKAVTKPTTATVTALVRTGSGNIDVAAAGDIDLKNGARTYENLDGESALQSQGGLQLGGTAIYTAGQLADISTQTVLDESTGQSFTLDPDAYENTTDVFGTPVAVDYAYGAGGTPQFDGFAGILVANPVYADGGGNVSLTAGQNVSGRRDVWQETRLAFYDIATTNGYSWLGESDQPWRVGEIGDITNIQINPQLFSSGVATLGGGNITIVAGANVSDLSIVADTSATTASVSSSASVLPTQALWQFGGGNVTVDAGRNLLGGLIDVASGVADIAVGRDIESDGTYQTLTNTGSIVSMVDGVRLRVSNAFANLTALGTVELQGISSLGVGQGANEVQNNLNAHGFYSSIAGVAITADGSVTIDNLGADVVTAESAATDETQSAVYPGTLEVASMTGSLDLATAANTTNEASAILLYPSPTGNLNLYAAADILPTTIAMLDADPGLLPGAFSTFTADAIDGVTSGQTFIFPGVLPDTSAVELAAMHNSDITHLDDPDPVRIAAGGDILDMILSVPKQARIDAGQDIVNMMFFGQNILNTDITRIVAGRDIVGTTELVQPVISASEELGPPLAAVEGNTFIIGGPGSFFLEAGRNAGPFLNSADTDGFVSVNGESPVSTGPLSYAGGVISIGDEWNPWLQSTGSNLYVEFGVGKGADYDQFANYYLNPANLAELPGYLFVQTTDSAGNMTPNRSDPIYAPILISWLQQNWSAQLVAAYGTTNISFQQAYSVFTTLPELQQRIFLIDDVYFNELTQTSIPSGPSYKEYSRGYTAVNLLFPASLGYTQNNLSGGANGANQTVETGNLDLRLAAIETVYGGNIYLLGPGGDVLGGSTVATSAQAALHSYNGGLLYSGYANDAPFAASIETIPAGYEGILTLRGGSIDTFTDTDFLLNQSRLFTEDGGDIAMWSSNGDLNAGEGPQTSANFPPVVVQTDDDLYTQVDSVGGVTGAGIAAFEPGPGIAPPDVFLIAPRGTVDAGAAGVRVAGDLFVAAFAVANANNFSVGGTSVGVPGAATVDVGTQTSASAASAASAQAAATASNSARGLGDDQSLITVDVLGYAGSECPPDDKKCKK